MGPIGPLQPGQPGNVHLQLVRGHQLDHPPGHRDHHDRPVTGPISSFSPHSGPAGTTVSSSGQGLAGATEVAFGTTPATITSDTAIQIQATVPRNYN